MAREGLTVPLVPDTVTSVGTPHGLYKQRLVNLLTRTSLNRVKTALEFLKNAVHSDKVSSSPKLWQYLNVIQDRIMKKFFIIFAALILAGGGCVSTSNSIVAAVDSLRNQQLSIEKCKIELEYNLDEETARAVDRYNTEIAPLYKNSTTKDSSNAIQDYTDHLLKEMRVERYRNCLDAL